MIRKLYLSLIVLALILQNVNIVYSNRPMNSPTMESIGNIKGKKINKGQKKYIITDDGLVIIDKNKIIKITISEIETKGSVTGAHYPGGWQNTLYNYRINITVIEPSGYDRVDWPVDVYVVFNPWANRQGIAVIDDSGNNVTFQVWNTTGNTTHMSSATITFLATVSAYGSAKYYIYYDTDPVGRPSFPTQVTLSVSTDTVTGETIYTIGGEEYSKVVLAPGKQVGANYIWTGGKILEIAEASTSQNLYTSPMNDIGISRNPSLGNPFGDANTSDKPEKRYIDSETQNGPIFILYKVINARIFDTSNNTIAKANFTYRFFKWGWIVEAYVKWMMDDTDPNATYWVGVYSFDQDNGIDVVYDRATSPSGTTTLGEGLPWTKSELDPDWGREDLTNNLRVFITANVTKDHQYLVELSWSGYADLDLFIYSERGFLIEGYDDLWDKIDGFVATQDYYESETATATKAERWIIVVLAYCSEGASASFTVTITDQTIGGTVNTFSGSFASTEFIYTSRYSAYCNYWSWNYPNTIDESREGNVDYYVGGYAKRYFADDEILAFILPMPRTGGDDYYIKVSWDLTYSDVHYHIYYPGGTEWTQDTSGGNPPLTRILYPTQSGDYPILIHYYDGSYYDGDDQSPYDDITVELYFEPPFAETEDYSSSGANWNWVAFYHHNYNRCIGFVNISLDINVGRTASAYEDIYWGNKGEGPSTDDDYILWALRIGGINALQNQWIRAKYSVVLEGQNNYQRIQYMADRLRHPLQTSVANIERFTLLITYNITDADNGPVVNALIKITNTTSGSVVVSGYTGGDGTVTFDIPRYDSYELNITLVSAHNTYQIVQNKDYSTFPYTTFSTTESHQFGNLVRIIIHCNDTQDKILQDAIVRFNGTSAYEYTNLTGHIDIYIQKGVWNLTMGYKYQYDQYNLTYMNDTYVKNTSNLDVAMVRWSTINITQGQEWKLIDLDAAAPPPLAIELREGSYSYEVYWGEHVYAKVAITSQGALVDADNNVTWKIEFAQNGSTVQGFDISKMNQVSMGIYDVNISTYKLPADYTYHLIIDVNTTTVGGKTYFFDVDGNKYQRPQPLVITIKVKPRPTKIVILTLTSNIYWDETFDVHLYYQDALNDSYILGANVEISFSGPTSFEQTMTRSRNEYYLTIPHFTYPTGSYIINIVASRGNYSTSTYITTVIVNKRPTEVFAPSYIEIPWSTENYNVTILYNDSRRGILVAGATTSYDIYDAYTQNLVATGTLIEISSKYIFSIPVYKIGIGTFTAEISLSKTYYEEKTFSITIVINARDTYATSNTTTVKVIWNETAYVLVSYYDNEYSPTQITGATVTFKVTPFGSNDTVYTGDLEPYGNDYLLTINFTQNLSIGNYKIKITLFKANFTSQSLEIALIIVPIPTYLTFSQKSAELEYSDVMTFKVWYQVYGTGEIIAGALASYDIYYGDYKILSGNMTYNSFDGSYEIYINTTRIVEKIREIQELQNITLPVTVSIYVHLEKSVYSSLDDVATIIIYNIACNVEVSETEIVAEWGENVSVLISIVRNKTLETVKGIQIALAGLPDWSWRIVETDEGYILLVDTTKLEVVEVINRSYLLTLTFYKPYHDILEKAITLTVTKITIDVKFAEPPPNKVTIIQFIERTKIIDIRILLEHLGLPVENANVSIRVYSIEAGIDREIIADKTTIPGVFSASIDWSEFPPGYKWILEVRVLSVQVYGRTIPMDKVDYLTLSHTIQMDYMSGSTKISVAGKEMYLANMYFYPLIISLLMVLMYGSYRFFSWYLLPWEVKEVIKILKMIKKGIFEYPAPSRREFILEMLSEELGVEMR